MYPKPRYALHTWLYQTDPSKRLTDAELAAEYWAPNWLTMPNADWEGDYEAAAQEMNKRIATLRRLATHEHYDSQES